MYIGRSNNGGSEWIRHLCGVGLRIEKVLDQFYMGDSEELHIQW